MLNNIILLILITLLPFLELRASIPYGIIVLNMNWILVFLICIIVNILLGPLIYFFLDKIIHLFLRINILDKLYSKYVEKTQKKIHPWVEKYGWIGIGLFIGIPLPGSGVYSGALAAYIIDLGYKKFIIATILGVLIAGIAVTIITLTGSSAFDIFIKQI